MIPIFSPAALFSVALPPLLNFFSHHSGFLRISKNIIVQSSTHNTYLPSSSLALILSPCWNLLCCNCQCEWWSVSVTVCLIAHLYTHFPTLTHAHTQGYVCALTECWHLRGHMPLHTHTHTHTHTPLCEVAAGDKMSELSISSLTSWSISPCSPPGQRPSYSQSGIHVQKQALVAAIVEEQRMLYCMWLYHGPVYWI